jgi:hypothetical protein
MHILRKQMLTVVRQKQMCADTAQAFEVEFRRANSISQGVV